MELEVTNLKTVKNYAMSNKVTASYIYKLVRENKMQTVSIDGVQFVDTSKFPVLPTKR